MCDIKITRLKLRIITLSLEKLGTAPKCFKDQCDVSFMLQYHVEDGQVVEHGLQFLLPQKKYMGKTLQKRQSGCFFSHSVRLSQSGQSSEASSLLSHFYPTTICTTEITSPEAADSSHIIPQQL